MRLSYSYLIFISLLFLSCSQNSNSKKSNVDLVADSLPLFKPESVKITDDYSPEHPLEVLTIDKNCLNEEQQLSLATRQINPWQILLKLFPGKQYVLLSKKSADTPGAQSDTLISWNCKNKVSNTKEDYPFPYENGVLTRLKSQSNYKDSKGNLFKIITFEHRSKEDLGDYLTGFSYFGVPITIGVIKLAWVNNFWEIRTFQPNISSDDKYFGEIEELLEIGKDQYAISIQSSSGETTVQSAGRTSYTLFAGINGKYRNVFQIKELNLTCPIGSWNGIVTVDKTQSKPLFKDVIVNIKGQCSHNEDDLLIYPEELESFMKKNKQIKSLDFTIKSTYTYNGTKYVIKSTPEVKTSNIKLADKSEQAEEFDNSEE